MAAIATVALALAGTVPADADVSSSVVPLEGGSPDAQMVSLSAATSMVESATVPIQAPSSTYGVDTGTAAEPSRAVSVPYATNYDFDHPWTYGYKVTTDGGSTFQTGTYHGIALALDDGRLLAWDSDWGQAVAGPIRKVNVQYSADSGTTWSTASQAQVDISPLSFVTTANFYPTSVIQVPGGPLLMGGYGGTSGGMTGFLLKSLDAGAHWTLVSVVGAADPTHAYTEVGLAQNAVGELVSVVRTQNPTASGDASYYTLRIRRAQLTAVAGAPADRTVTWETSTPIALPAALDATIMPRLSLLPNGMLALVGGRNHNWLAVSYAGDGRTWDYIGTFYRNYPSGVTGGNTFNYGSSGNASLAWTEPNRVLLTADTCHLLRNQDTGQVTNNCTRGGLNSPNTTAGVQRVLADLLRRNVGKIDLGSKYRAGAIQVSSSLDSTFAAHPRTGVAAAFDGSNEQWSSAIAAGASQGTFDITLDGAYTLNRIGISQSVGHTQSSVVQTKLNAADPWTDWFTAGPNSRLAMTYYEPGARQARYVRIVTGASDGCLPGAGPDCSVLNELELYSTVDSFENDPLSGATPRGWVVKETIVNGAGRIGCWATQNTSGSGSSRALLINDAYTDHLPTAFQKANAAASRTVEFRTKFLVGDGPMLFGIRNTNTTTFDSDDMAFHLMVSKSGAISYYKGGTWNALPVAKTFDMAAWNKIAIQATSPTSATVLINGIPIGTLPRTDGAAGALYGPQFSSSSTADTGDQFLIDDVLTS
ncbi:hypothetical protein HDA40_007927 [Hamadaea flava]|uniref:Sialidase family protein n=1 Tax=Hamadaea flava TaxID=1742688 RepID=A0ABV8LZM8_9ACTN|nr:hypothetical protein [Hamadaea flava]